MEEIGETLFDILKSDSGALQPTFVVKTAQNLLLTAAPGRQSWVRSLAEPDFIQNYLDSQVDPALNGYWMQSQEVKGDRRDTDHITQLVPIGQGKI